MFQINGSNIKPRNTARRGVEYMPTMKLDDNKRIGELYDSTGAVEAKGSLYPTGFNNSGGIGSVQSLINTNYTGESDFALDNESYTNNEVKFKTAPNFFQGFKKLVSITLGFIQQVFTNVTTGVWNTTGRIRVKKAYAISTTTFVFIFEQTGGTAGVYAVVATVNATTGALTFGTAVILTTVIPTDGYSDFCEINTAKYVYVQQKTATLILNIVFTISGTTITAGTAVDETITSSTLGNTRVRVAKVDTDKYLVHHWSTANSNNFAYLATVSGTVPTLGANTSINGGSNGNYPTVALESTTKGMFFFGNASNNLVVQVFTLSGTTFTLGTSVTLGASGEDAQVGNYGTGRALPNGDYYYHNVYSAPHEYYIGVSGTVASLIQYLNPSTIAGSSYSTKNADEWYIDANEWCYVVNQGSQDYLIHHKYDSGTGKIYTSRKKILSLSDNQWGGNSITNSAIVKCGSQFIMIGSTTSNAVPFYYQTAQAGSCGVYFEDEVSASATLTNATLGWAMTKQTVNKAINKLTAYFSLKNVTGNTVLLKTKDWLFEVE